MSEADSTVTKSVQEMEQILKDYIQEAESKQQKNVDQPPEPIPHRKHRHHHALDADDLTRTSHF